MQQKQRLSMHYHKVNVKIPFLLINNLRKTKITINLSIHFLITFLEPKYIKKIVLIQTILASEKISPIEKIHSIWYFVQKYILLVFTTCVAWLCKLTHMAKKNSWFKFKSLFQNVNSMIDINTERLLQITRKSDFSYLAKQNLK